MSGATLAVSTMDVKAQNWDGPARPLKGRPASRAGSVLGDTSSIRSFMPSSALLSDGGSIFGGGLADRNEASDAVGGTLHEDLATTPDDDYSIDLGQEFQDISEIEDEDAAQALWTRKKKHFLILSAAGKPIYTRHGSDSTISNYVGVIQTVISTYKSWDDDLRMFTTDHVSFVVLAQTNLFLVAISALPESEAQVRVQLEALYTQILSTLTLPQLEHIFSVRPSADLRRPLQGTEVLLSALADSFTRGSPSTLLQALESLRVRKSHRQIIHSTMLQARTDKLLYGLIVAGGRLVSVIRPKKHSLHPGDLHLIFNMLFEAEGIKAGGGESFIPVCLPAFNNTGFLHMYVSFLDVLDESARELAVDEKAAKEDTVAIILLSANKDSFEDLRSMKRYLVHELRKNGCMRIIHKAVQNNRPLTTDIVPGTVLKHFLYKSKGNVQFFMPSYSPHFEDAQARRQLYSIYHKLHGAAHAKYTAVKVQHVVTATTSTLAWVTPMFELYCVAGPTTPRNALAQHANKVVQWVQKEEERIFLIGGAVF